MAAADEAEHTRTRSGIPRRRGSGHGHGHAHHAHPDPDAQPGAEEDIDAVNRLMGFLREDEA
jgi:hypothetical protein